MATGGRVVHHLAHLAPEPRNFILLAGFQVPGTREAGHYLTAPTLSRCIAVTCRYGRELIGMDEFSAHADSNDVLAWLRTAPTPPETC